MQEIVPGLFLGPYASATRNSLEKMKAANLTHVVCVRSVHEAHLIRANHQDHFQYLIVQMEDSEFQSLIPYLKTVSVFIEQCLNSGGKVLVHGNAGMSRSAALVIGYIMAKYGVTFKKSARYVQSKRFCICVNKFKQQLKDYEPIYKADHSAMQQDDGAGTGGAGSAQFRATKRSIDEVDDSDDDDEEGHNGPRLRPRMDSAGGSEDVMDVLE